MSGREEGEKVMRKYEVVLAVELPKTRNRFEVEADGIGYHNDGEDLVMVLYVLDDQPKTSDTQVERPVFAVPVRGLAYVREIAETEAEQRAALLQQALDSISDLDEVTVKGADHMGIPDGLYVSRAAIGEILAATYDY
jgi:hypothetical protein